MNNLSKSNVKLNVLVVGAGMYVCGKNTDSFGTILPALNEMFIENKVQDIYVTATSSKSIDKLYKKVEGIKKLTKSSLNIIGLPKNGDNASSYLDSLEMFKPDCAIIAVPDQYHFDIASRLIERGIHLLLVKPLTPTIVQSKKLISLAKNNDVYGVVEFHKRLDAANLKLKDFISSGTIGDILYAHIEYSQRRVIPLEIFRSWIDGTNIFQYLGVHYVDIIYFVTGYTPTRLIATGQKTFLKNEGFNTFDAIQVLIEWQSNNGNSFTSTILTNWIDPNNTSAISDQKIKIIGSNGRIESDQKDRGLKIVTENHGIEDINPYFNQTYPLLSENRKVFRGYGIESIKQFCYDIIDLKLGLKSIKNFENSRPTFKDSLCSTAVIQAVDHSLNNNNEWVNISY